MEIADAYNNGHEKYYICGHLDGITARVFPVLQSETNEHWKQHTPLEMRLHFSGGNSCYIWRSPVPGGLHSSEQQHRQGCARGLLWLRSVPSAHQANGPQGYMPVLALLSGLRRVEKYPPWKAVAGTKHEQNVQEGFLPLTSLSEA